MLNTSSNDHLLDSRANAAYNSITQSELRNMRSELVRAGVVGSAWTVAATSGAIFALSRLSPAIARTTIPSRVFVVTMLSTGVGVSCAERRMLAFRSESRAAKAAALSANTVNNPVLAKRLQEHENLANMSTWEAVRTMDWNRWLIVNKFYVIGGIWAASMVGSLALSFRNPNIKPSQKLIHARVYAQGLTVAAVVASAAVAPFDHKGDQEEKDAMDLLRYEAMGEPSAAKQ
ncbi:hypothetical protein CAOG_01882 [Capsaspora owczarzaki ATCC 30864]|uniref:HIG1 domain-containing protein n=1 Tax=Capsaspora owczarzaki (strain ATCC 30864) TaxID=595528 RepID=A0A0D2U637_CAPO3|nr:hypothetical protein CAOG_01882 [Capsaspora owczarzaki ATCC 30864]KJE90586.1 hypothetical protein CAOG_001882 [Capsaspora owczarzaki ATCC 30864]|eukprot:XP_004364750.1 hypothetical protein CAOG_01882 [Capsaspora owczarzaki ATCC 30864]